MTTTRTTTPTPLADAVIHDMWRPVPFGTTPRGRRYDLPLTLQSHLLIGGERGTGRTNTLRQVIAAGALDPAVQLSVWAARPDGQHAMWEPICDTYGADATDPDTCRRLVETLTRLAGEMRRRYQALRDLPECPRGTLTAAVAADPDRAMPVTVVAIDGLDRFLSGPDGRDIGRQLRTLANTGLAAGLVVAATADASRRLPTDLTDVVGVRFATRTANRTNTQAVLGAGHLRTVVDPSAIGHQDRGMGVLIGAQRIGAAALIRTYRLDDDLAAVLAQRARDLRGVGL